MTTTELADGIETTLEERGQLDTLQYFRALRRLAGTSGALRMIGVEVTR